VVLNRLQHTLPPTFKKEAKVINKGFQNPSLPMMERMDGAEKLTKSQKIDGT